MNKTYLKRRYYDFRNGGATLSPVIQLSNFLMLAYLTISNYVSIYLFAPLFVITVITSFVFMGHYFRKIQISTDLDMSFEMAQMQGKTLYNIMWALDEIMKSNNIKPTQEFIKSYSNMKNIANGIHS